MNEQQPNPNQPQAPAEQPVQQPVQPQQAQPQQPAPQYNAPTNGGGNKKTLLIIIIVVIAVLIVLGIVGSILLRKAGEKIFEEAVEYSSGNEVDINFDDGKMEFQDKETGATFATGQIPDNCPKEILIYPKADVMSAFCGVMGPDNHAIMLFSKDSQQEVSNYYKSELIKNGWQIKDNEMLLMGMINLAYIKNDMVLSIGLTPAEEGDYKTMISLSYILEGAYDGEPGYDYY